jgi:hypothetical protein
MNRTVNHISTLILMLLSAIPLTHLVICSFYLEVDQRLPLFLIIAVLFCWLVFSFLPYKLLGLALCLGLMLIFYQGRSELIITQFKDIASRIVSVYYNHYTNGGYAISFSTLDHTEAMLFFGFIVTMLLGIALTSIEERILLAVIICLPIIVPCLLVYGFMPWWIMLCLTLFGAMLFATGHINEPDSNFGRSFFVLVLPAAIFLCLLLLFKGPDNYDYDKQSKSVLELTQQYTDKLAKLLNLDSELSVTVEDTASDSDSSSDDYQNPWSSDGSTLDATAELDQDAMQDVLMYVKSSEDTYLYLRHKSYGAYLGTGWGTAPEYPGGSVPSFAAKAIENSGEFSRNSLEISIISADTELLYQPYYTLQSMYTDSYSYSESSEYSVSYLTLESGYRSLSLPSDLVSQELSYRQYVYNNYLALPDSTSSVLKSIAEEKGLKSDDTLTTISLVADCVRNSAVYNVEAAAYPTDDYAVYLFTEATEGYCVHFATAATAMYRALGIPARLVTGLAVSVEANTDVEVTRSSEHAWVEVYVDAIGWLPVEVTPGISDVSGIPDDTIESTPSPAPDNSVDDVTPSPAQEDESLPNEQESSEENSDSEDADSSILQSILDFLRRVLIVILCIAAVALVFLLWYQGNKMLWIRRFGAAPNRAAINIWKCAGLICRFGGEMPVSIQSSAQKAFYGRGISGVSELNTMVAALEELRESTYAAIPWYKKFLFKFIYGLK